MKKSVQLALLILFGLLAYFGIRTVLRGDDEPAAATPAVLSIQSEEQANVLPEIVFMRSEAEPHPIYLSLKGRTTPNRSVTVRAATTGTVIAAPTNEGATVNRGRALCRLDIDARQARLAEAEAMVESRGVDYRAAQELAEKGWASPNRAASAKASLDAAQAELNSAKIELRRTEITAPFAGVFEQRLAEVGDFLSPGTACGVVTDFDPIKVQTDVTEEFATRFTLGAPVEVDIVGLPVQEGQISYVSRTAEDNTRTFRVVANIPNEDGLISAGLTSNLRVQLGEAMATPISAALMTLHDDGRVGVRYLDDADTVQFAEITVVDDTGDVIWITGLPETVRLLTAGQEYVKEGTLIAPVDIDEASQL
ncbi:MAG: efflux RND transporter periplasmic adaptor subunit [Pseudomonadota bacterium]